MPTLGSPARQCPKNRTATAASALCNIRNLETLQHFLATADKDMVVLKTAV
jgi:hypothetical protein